MSARHPSPPPAASLCVESGVKYRSVYSCFHIILLEPCWTPRMSPSARRCWVWLHSSLIEDVERRESAAHHRVDVMESLSRSWWVLSVYAKWTKEHLYFIPTHQNDAVAADHVPSVGSYHRAFSSLQSVVSFFHRISYWGEKRKHSSPRLIHWAAPVTVQRGGKDKFSQGRLPPPPASIFVPALYV